MLLNTSSGDRSEGETKGLEWREWPAKAEGEGELSRIRCRPASTAPVTRDGIELNNVVGTIRLREDFSLPLIVSFLSHYFICRKISSRD